MSHCEVKRARHGEQLEVLVNKFTEFERSSKKFAVSKGTKSSDAVELSRLETLAAFQRVLVEGKVVGVDDAVEVSGGKKKQDIVVGDASGTARVTVWETEIGKMKKEQSYRLSGMMVREFRGEKFLSTSKENSKIEEIDDIGHIEVAKEEEEEERPCSSQGGPSGMQHLEDVRIIGVDRLDGYAACLKCKSKVVPDEEDEEFGECGKCKMLQLIEECKKVLTAQVIVKSERGVRLTLRVFEQVILDIAQKSADDITAKVLMKAKPFGIKHFDGIIRAVSRKA